MNEKMLIHLMYAVYANAVVVVLVRLSILPGCFFLFAFLYVKYIRAFF